MATSSPSPTPGATPLPEGVLASIKLRPGSAPSAVSIGYGSVWVESHRGFYLYRIDPTTDAITAAIDMGQESCGDIGVGLDRLWLSPCDTGTKIMAVDPSTNQVVGGFAGTMGEWAFPGGSVWASRLGRGTQPLLRVDPVTLRQVSAFRVGSQPTGAVDGDGYLWVIDEDALTGEYGGFVSKVDPATGKVLATINTPDPGTYAYLTWASGALWLKGIESDQLLRVDPETGAVQTFHLQGWSQMTQLYDCNPFAADGSLWMRIGDDRIARFDPASGTITATYPSDPMAGGGDVAVGFGSLWISNFGADTVWRVRLTP